METENFSLPPDRPKWSWWDVIIVLAVLLALMPMTKIFRTAIREVILILRVTGLNPQSLLLFLGTALQAFVIILGVVLLTRRKGATGKDLGLRWGNGIINILTGLFGGLILWSSVLVIGFLLSMITGPPPPQEVETILRGLKTVRDMWLPFISVSVLAPLSEELYIRGMAYPVIRARFGPVAGMVLSALFFGALHLDLYRLIPITCGGIGLAYLYEKTKSLLAPIIAHATWNTLMLLMLFLAGKLQLPY